MKRILSMTISLALVLSLATTAFATEGGEQPQEVSTLEELQAAVTAAEDGYTIAVSAEITLDGVALETDKDITLVRADTYESGAFCAFNMVQKFLVSALRIILLLQSFLIHLWKQRLKLKIAISRETPRTHNRLYMLVVVIIAISF